MSLLQVGHYRPLLVLPLGLAAGVAPGPLAGRAQDGAALLLVAGFALLNVRYCAPTIDVCRDPAVYAITGEWPTHHLLLRVIISVAPSAVHCLVARAC